ncbi:ABC transporter permease [Hydrogenophaga sp. IBVHS2]|uniref:ABC transporter permease n=1 Tax=Hydrogenophaga sp. IBVHS2 TaxID=1985170 RepID=UPI000A2DB092|nr:ABC transporter permease [Hydrogenophaga sp. IBVHS2]OSZ67663.1 multidrug ABC transporter substrate-binding protein [Hydrogenophaga sp. IBVHS2]
MNTLTAIRSAWRSLRANKLRSMLTMLGIIIGVAAVITMIAVGGGATQRVQEQMKSLGSNVMLVLPGSLSAAGVRQGAQTRSRFTEEDVQAIMAEIPEVQAAAPGSRTTAQAVAQNANWNTTIFGTTNEYLDVRDWALASGRLFEPAEQSGSAKVAWIGQTVARELFGDQDPVDQVIRVRGVPFTIVGVLERKGQNASGQDQDDIVVMPMSTFRNRIWNAGGNVRRIWTIFVKVREGQDMKATEQSVRDLLRQRLRVSEEGDDTFSVNNLSEVLQAQEEASRVMTWLLSAVAGVSLIVGGIGIMNIMLVSVTERTREIGLRMAVGARGRDILAQFLIEAVTLSLIGGAIGVVLGAAATWATAEVAGWEVSMSVQAVVLAASFAALVGVFFGYYPARRASGLLPIEALRHE